MMEQNAIFEDRFQAWFRSLSPEGRAAALSVKDDDFLSTLIHFASLSSSSPRSNDDGMAEIDGGECFVSRARKKVVRGVSFRELERKSYVADFVHLARA
jgi:hypothetical protein